MRRTNLMLPIILTFLAVCAVVNSLDNGLGRTPPMGWNSWNRFGCDINEGLIRRMADSLVSTGLADIGYTYVNVDDCWQMSRDPVTGVIIEDKQKFPSGMAALSNYVHSKGLKFGIYSSAGTHTCQGRPGSLGYEEIDAKTYAEWKVDFFKYDNCFNRNVSHVERYTRMRDALNATGRPIFYSLCQWGEEQVWTWAADVGNSWRTTGDICDNFGDPQSECSVLSILDQMEIITQYGRPGAWNDPDMLEVGNGNMTSTMYRTHFSFWAALKAPLILGNDLSQMTEETLTIINNTEIIAVNQDPLGKSISRVLKTDDNWELWSGPLGNGDLVVIIFNRFETHRDWTMNWSLLGFDENGFYCAKDLWMQEHVVCFHGSGSLDVTVQGWGVVMLRIGKRPY